MSIGNSLPTDERGRGILTEADREFLRGDKELENEQSRRDARYRIRKRIRNAIFDFSILTNHLADRDLKLVFDAFFREFDSREEFISSADETSLQQIIKDTMFIGGVKDCIAFLYKGTYESDFPFDELIESGINDVENQQGHVVEDVTVTISVEIGQEIDIHDLLKRLDEGEPLTRDEFSALLRSGELDIALEDLDTFFTDVLENFSGDLDDLPDFDEDGDKSDG